MNINQKTINKQNSINIIRRKCIFQSKLWSQCHSPLLSITVFCVSVNLNQLVIFIFHIFISYFFDHNAWVVGSQFPDQGLNSWPVAVKGLSSNNSTTREFPDAIQRNIFFLNHKYNILAFLCFIFSSFCFYSHLFPVLLSFLHSSFTYSLNMECLFLLCILSL